MRKPSIKEGDKVKCLRLSPNLGNKGTIGQVYQVLHVTPKVRVTPGTGEYFLNCVCDTHRASFNLMDVKKIK